MTTESIQGLSVLRLHLSLQSQHNSQWYHQSRTLSLVNACMSQTYMSGSTGATENSSKPVTWESPCQKLVNYEVKRKFVLASVWNQGDKSILMWKGFSEFLWMERTMDWMPARTRPSGGCLEPPWPASNPVTGDFNHCFKAKAPGSDLWLLRGISAKKQDVLVRDICSWNSCQDNGEDVRYQVSLWVVKYF